MAFVKRWQAYCLIFHLDEICFENYSKMFCPQTGNNLEIMKLRILYHGNCFDGVSSAAIFTKFYQTKIHPNAEVFYSPTMHRAGNAFDREQFDGDENAIVDFKYSPDERLTWWFDHHQSAFLSEADETAFSR